MLIGTTSKIVKVPYPSIGSYENTGTNFISVNNFLNGGASVRDSSYGAHSVPLNWNFMGRSEVNKILSVVSESRGLGSYIYFEDPFAYENVIPDYWASPYLALRNAPELLSNATVASFTTPTNNYNLPSRGITYTGGSSGRVDRFMVPSGYSYRVTAWGSGTNIIVRSNDNVNYTVPWSSYTLAPTWVTVTGKSGLQTIRVTGDLTLVHVVVEVYKTAPIVFDSYRVGRGISGAKVSDNFTVRGYSSILNLQTVSLTLMEVEPWSLS